MTTTNCPLCGCADGVPINQYEFATIWRWLEQQHGARFTQDLIDAHSPAKITSLLKCSECGLQYFSPATSGNSEFYRQLTYANSSYYSPIKWDFKCAISCAKKSVKLLDIACGGGAFLEYAQSFGHTVQGIDTNPLAIDQARSRELNAQLISLEQFSKVNAGRFDLVTAFQVLEHISSILPFTQHAAHCLRPGGRLLVSVPNRYRFWRNPNEPLDCPPHHLSRWAKPQLEELAQRCGLKLKRVHYEPASALDLLTPLQQWQQPAADANAHGVALGKSRAPSHQALIGFVKTQLERPSRLLGLLRFRRLSMLAELIVPER